MTEQQPGIERVRPNFYRAVMQLAMDRSEFNVGHVIGRVIGTPKGEKAPRRVVEGVFVGLRDMESVGSLHENPKGTFRITTTAQREEAELQGREIPQEVAAPVAVEREPSPAREDAEWLREMAEMENELENERNKDPIRDDRSKSHRRNEPPKKPRNQRHSRNKPYQRRRFR